jgi:hypothetical protein
MNACLSNSSMQINVDISLLFDVTMYRYKFFNIYIHSNNVVMEKIGPPSGGLCVETKVNVVTCTWESLSKTKSQGSFLKRWVF